MSPEEALKELGVERLPPILGTEIPPPLSQAEYRATIDVRTVLKSAAAFCGEYEPVSYVVEPFIRSSSLYTLTARTGAGKTALFIVLLLAVVTGRGKELLGREVERGRAVVIVAENPDGFRMRLMVAAYLHNIDLQAIGDDLLVIDMRMRPEAIAEALKPPRVHSP